MTEKYLLNTYIIIIIVLTYIYMYMYVSVCMYAVYMYIKYMVRRAYTYAPAPTNFPPCYYKRRGGPGGKVESEWS
jgi:hypothetical protein